VQQSITFDRIEGINPKFKGLKPATPKSVKVDKFRKNDKNKVAKKKIKSKAPVNKTFHEAEDVGFAPMRRKKKVETPSEES